MTRYRQRITLVRVTEIKIGKLRLLFWEGGGQTFHGKACHMKALRAAREGGSSRTIGRSTCTCEPGPCSGPHASGLDPYILRTISY
jgi:hypothetical protein